MNDDPFAAYGASGSSGDTILRFSKGQYIAGVRDGAFDMTGEHVIALMDSMKVGWIKWSSNRPIQYAMGRIVDGFKVPLRNTLGDNDQHQWTEYDSKGYPRDPWQLTDSISFADQENGEIFTFSASAEGQKRSLRELCAAYAKERQAHPNEWPVVSLDIRTWEPPTWEPVKFPLFTIVGWTAKQSAPEVPPGNPPQPAAAPPRQFISASAQQSNKEFDDEIPF
jgi:hypothetical protein